jgi:hypothetical protein
MGAAREAMEAREALRRSKRQTPQDEVRFFPSTVFFGQIIVSTQNYTHTTRNDMAHDDHCMP